MSTNKAVIIRTVKNYLEEKRMFDISEIMMIKLSIENELALSKSLTMDKCVIEELESILNKCNDAIKENHNHILACRELTKWRKGL